MHIMLVHKRPPELCKLAVCVCMTSPHPNAMFGKTFVYVYITCGVARICRC